MTPYPLRLGGDDPNREAFGRWFGDFWVRDDTSTTLIGKQIYMNIALNSLPHSRDRHYVSDSLQDIHGYPFFWAHVVI